LENDLDDFLDLLENPDSLITSVKIKDIDDNFIYKLKKLSLLQALSLGVLDILNFNWKPELSSGQENYLFQFASFYDILRNATNLKNDIIILIDEGETTMHPNWQKRYLKYYLDFLEKNFKDKNFHLILTSHSPFILSDLPKDNVIFLEKDEKTSNCKNATKDVNINTFGANIHTLLSNGFFMKNGLMGEFAKNKINEAIKYLNQKALTEKEIDYCEDILSVIGEPILKNQLQKMLDSKRHINIDDISKKIKDMEYELSVLKKYQKKATKDELKDRAKQKYTKKKKDD